MQFVNYINHLGVEDRWSPSSRLPCTTVSNSQNSRPARSDSGAALRNNAPAPQKPEDASLWQALASWLPVPPGESLLPAKYSAALPVSPLAQALLSAAQLITFESGKIQAGSAYNAALNTDQTAFSSSLLESIDKSVSRITSSLLPWTAVSAQQPGPVVDAPAFTSTATAMPLHHHPDDNIGLFCQQIDEFLTRIDCLMSDEQQQQLVTTLARFEVVFFSVAGAAVKRPTRALEGSIRENFGQAASQQSEQYQQGFWATLTEGLDEEGGALLVWSDETMLYAEQLFMRGIELKDPRYFSSSGLIIIVAWYASLLGKTFQGTLLDRDPGETKADWLLRLSSNVAMMPDAAGAKAFGMRNRAVKINASASISMKTLPGTAITHSATGLTLHTVLRKEIAGQYWQLFPLGNNHGTAIKVGVMPQVSRPATRNTQNNSWKISGISGEHTFTHSGQPEYFIATAEGYFSVKQTADEGVLRLSGDKTIYFNSRNRCWQEYYPNRHLHVRVLSSVADEAISSLPGEQMLTSVSGLERKVWYSADNGKQYLEIRSRAADNPNNVVTGYVEGLLEDRFFTLTATRNEPVYQQTVLEWRSALQKWDTARSPFSALKIAADKIPGNRLVSRQALPGAPVSRYHQPGLYKAGEGFFLRWLTGADGGARYLELLPTRFAGEFQAVLAGEGQPVERVAASHISYSEEAMEWQFREVKHQAFFGLPDEVKLRPNPPLMVSERLPGHLEAYRRENAVYLQIGSDKHGEAEFIRVEQDPEDEDLFILRSAPPQSGKSWLFRYGEEDEFILEQESLCRVRRAGEEECAGPSSKKTRYEETNESAIKQLLNEYPRLWREKMLVENNESIIVKNMAYALRLYRLSQGKVSLRSISWHAGVSEKGLKARLARITVMQQTAAEEYQWLVDNPQHEFETFKGYALRLYRTAGPDVTLQMIATWTGVNRASLKVAVDALSNDALNWLNMRPRNEGEEDMDYAVRLSQLPHPGISTSDIARHAGVDKFNLYTRLRLGIVLKPLPASLLDWFGRYPQQKGERDMDYALRLIHLRNLKSVAGNTEARLITDRQIAQHSKINPDTLATEVCRLAQAHDWLQSLRRQPDELPDNLVEANRRYVLRLVRQRYLDKKRKRIRLYEISAHAGVLTLHTTLWIKSEKEAWFARYQRLPDEKASEDEDGDRLQSKNLQYSLRLIAQREQQQLHWLINDQDIARQASVTLDGMRQARDEGISGIKSELAEMPSGELTWRPLVGRLHLKIKQNAPLLTAPGDTDRSITYQMVTQPLEISNLNEVLRGVKGGQRKQLEANFMARAQELFTTDGSRQDDYLDEQGVKQQGFLSEYLEVLYDEQHPQLGLQIQAKKDIAENTIIGAYTGVWHETEASLKQEYRKLGSQRVLTYLWGAWHREGGSSGYLNANKLALINTADMGGFASLGENNLALCYLNDKIPLYYTTRPIKQGEQLLISYGDVYYPEYNIQRVLNNEVISTIAGVEQSYFNVVDSAGEPLVAYGPAGRVEAKDIPEQARKYVLQERIDKRGILRYDAVKVSGKRRRRIAIGRDDANNLYHAMAKVIYPFGGRKLIEEKIDKMIAEVKAEQERIKAEPL